MRKIYPSNFEQDFSGWFDDLKNIFSTGYEEVKAWAGNAYETSKQYYDTAQNWMNQGQDYVYSKYKEVQEKFNELLEEQKKVDEALALMPDSDYKKELLKKRNESRSFANKYVIPLWQEFSKLTGISKDTSLGAIPLVAGAFGLAAVGVSIALLAYVANAIANERAIFNDPELKKIYLKELAKSGGQLNLSGMLSSLKMPLILASVGFIAYTFMKNKDFSRK